MICAFLHRLIGPTLVLPAQELHQFLLLHQTFFIFYFSNLSINSRNFQIIMEVSIEKNMRNNLILFYFNEAENQSQLKLYWFLILYTLIFNANINYLSKISYFFFFPHFLSSITLFSFNLVNFAMNIFQNLLKLFYYRKIKQEKLLKKL